MTPSEYRDYVIETAANFLGILEVEKGGLERYAQAVGPADAQMWLAHITIAEYAAGRLQHAALVAKSQTEGPGLTDADGRPLSRQEKRKLVRKATKAELKKAGLV